jgi:CYTH domain-containing protein
VAVEPDGNEVRVRDKGGKFFTTVKSGGTLERAEYEFEIDADMFESLWPFTLSKRVEKVRYRLPMQDGLVCELDIFSGDLEGLVMAEVEFPDAQMAESFSVPDWFGEDVTSDSRYKNKNLATKGL